MKKHFMSHQSLLKAALLLSMCCIPLKNAEATNGLRLIGVGPVNTGLGGAGVAKPQTTDAIYTNPAGMNDIGNRADLSFTVGFPSSTMDTHLAPAGNPSAINVGGDNLAALIPNGSIVFSFMDNNKLSFGLGSFLTSGFQLDYPISRINSALTGNTYDRSGRYADLKIIPAVSYRILDNLSIGVGIDLNYAFLNTDSAVLTSPTLAETSGGSRYDAAMGIGGRLGLIYRPLDILQVGFMYSTPQIFQEFDVYQDLFTQALNLPQEINVGAAIMPLEGVLLLTDFRWINWSGVGQLGDSIAQQGLNWQDQYVFILGAQYDFKPHFDVPIQVRAGYNYGRSPIHGPGVFANILSPNIGENHLTGGLTFEVSKNIGFDAAYFRDFGNTVTDDGSGNPAFAGSSFSVSANSFSIGIHGRWGENSESKK